MGLLTGGSLLSGGGLLSGGSGINVFQHVQLNVAKTFKKLTLSTCLSL